MDGVVLGINREQFPTGLRCGRHDEFAGGDENFFVRQCDGAAELHSFLSGFEPDDANRRGNDDIGTGMRTDGEHSLAAMMDCGERLEILFTEAAGKLVGELWGGQRHYLRVIPKNLGIELIEVVAGR